jgi:hypothetical protein
MVDFSDLEERIDSLSTVAQAGRDPALRSRIEFTLSEGYVCALTAEAELRRLDRRLDALLEAMDAERARELRAVAVERRLLGERVERLRARLAVLRERFVAVSES